MKYLIPLLFPLIVLADSQTTGNLITNGNFNNGTTGWTLQGDAQRIGDCCPGGHDFEFGDSGSIEQSFDLLSNTITQPMLNNGITLNSSVEVQNGECGVSGCWGGSGGADTFTIRLQIRDSDSNVLATTTQERTNVTGINGKDFTDSVSYTGTGSNIGNLFISGSDANSPANLGGPNVDNISVTMTYDDEVLSAIQTSHITTTFQEIEEVLFSKAERVEFEEFTEIPSIALTSNVEFTQIEGYLTQIEEIQTEEINTGVVEIFTVTIEEEIIPMEIVYEEPKAIEAFTTEVESFEERIEATESFSETEVEEFTEEIIAEEITAEAPVKEVTSETVEQTETVNTTPEEETTVVAEEVNEVIGEGETDGGGSGNGGTETVATGEDALESRDTEVEESRNEGSPRVNTQAITVESIEKKVNETLKRVDQRLMATSLIIAKAMESNISLDNYGQTNNNIFNNQLFIDGGSYDEQTQYIDLRNIYAENQTAYNDPMAKSQKILQESIDNRIRTEEHLRRIRGF